mmetsp:Transcript_3929/g.6966  ORF Transcript_3929/g.6966 Transcript_3929/m.6966 type:complete len:117 (+) Transcript_3929:586-936(+)
MTKNDATFNLVWTYNVKEMDGRKKARCACDGSLRASQARVLDFTYTNYVDQTSSRLFCAISTRENLMVFDADVKNAFGEAPPLQQGFTSASIRRSMTGGSNIRNGTPFNLGRSFPY